MREWKEKKTRKRPINTLKVVVVFGFLRCLAVTANSKKIPKIGKCLDLICPGCQELTSWMVIAIQNTVAESWIGVES